jgi:hypothetical protein
VAPGLFTRRKLTLVQNWDGARSFAAYLNSR